MLRFLQCIGLGPSAESMAGTTISRHARGMFARKQAGALRKAAADRVTARLDIRRTLKKASRRGYGVYTTRLVSLSADESSLVYAKPGAGETEKTLPFAQMEPPTVAGCIVTISMRNQAKATSIYKFQAASEAEAKVWGHAVSVFVPVVTPVRKVSSAISSEVTAPAA